MEIHSTPIPVPEVKFRDRTHPGYVGWIDNIARPRDHPYYLLWKRSPIRTVVPKKTFDVQSGYAQQMGVTRFFGKTQPWVNPKRSMMTPRSGNLPRIQGVQGDDLPTSGFNVEAEDSKYLFPAIGFGTVEFDQPKMGGHMTQVHHNPIFRRNGGFYGPSNPVVNR